MKLNIPITGWQQLTFFQRLSSARQSDDDDSTDSFRELSRGSTSGICSSSISSGSSFSFFAAFFNVSLLGRFNPLVGPSYLGFKAGYQKIINYEVQNDRYR